MSKKYKVWIHVECVDEKNDHYEDVTDPVELAVYNVQWKAEELVGRLEKISDIIKDCMGENNLIK